MVLYSIPLKQPLNSKYQCWLNLCCSTKYPLYPVISESQSVFFFAHFNFTMVSGISHQNANSQVETQLFKPSLPDNSCLGSKASPVVVLTGVE